MNNMLTSSLYIDIGAPASVLWDVLTQAAYTKQYMFNCEVKSSLKVGDDIECEGEYQGYKAYQKGKVQEVVPLQKLVYTTFDPKAGMEDTPKNHIKVTYEIATVEGNTRLHIENRTEDGSAERMEHIKQGWSMVKERIKEVAEKAAELA